MGQKREFWVETTDRTCLYYKVVARSKEEALENFIGGEGEYVGCNDRNNEHIHDVLEERPYIAWT